MTEYTIAWHQRQRVEPGDLPGSGFGRVYSPMREVFTDRWVLILCQVEILWKNE
jgi:hypothetical protein